jgi:hypothetical protein
MGVATAVKIPPLPANTAGQWLPVICEDLDMVRRWLKVMHQMDRRYLRERTQVFCWAPGHRPNWMGASYYYWTPTSEVVLRMVYLGKRDLYQIMSVGFVGKISPKEALELLIEQAIVYLRSRAATSALALVPKSMDNPQVLKLYDLVPRHPRLRVTVEGDWSAVRRWHIEVPELVGTASS